MNIDPAPGTMDTEESEMCAHNLIERRIMDDKVKNNNQVVIHL